ncbi:MAG: CvpA family protein [Candidatus Limnocylindrales bacterium]|jgi:uncharacterized membrane protein required for colicin V production
MIGAIQSAPLVDLAIFIGLFAAFILGVMQGAIRRILGIISILFAFLVSANLRGPIGDYLADHWRQFPSGYNHMLAFAILFCFLTVAFSILIQGFYKRTELSAAHPILDDIVGGLLGLLQAFILLTIAVIILGSYTMPDPFPGDIDQLRRAQDLLIHQSHVAGAIRDTVVPVVIHLLSWLLPSDLVSIFS